MNKTALLNVARALRESPDPAKFDMDKYANSCGTPACALGHYGFRTDLQSIIKPTYSSHQWWLEYVAPELDGVGCDYFDLRMAEHFGLTDSQMTELFSGTGCDGAQTTTEAAEYIERFVQGD